MNIRGVEVLVEGDGAETIVMVHGWPDTWRLWDAQVAALKARYRCVRFTLPGFDEDKPARPLTMDGMVEFLARIADWASPQAPVILLLHDWGCGFGYEFAMRHPARVSRIVGVDIGDPRGLARAMSARAKLMVLAYQMWLALAWKVGGPVGDWMTSRMARWIGRPAGNAHVSWKMNYPYYLSWFGGEHAYRRHMQSFDPQCPLLFIYGAKKPFMFHTRRWAEKMAARPGNRVEEFPTGHWVMLQEPARFSQVVGDWLAAGSRAAAS